MQEEEVPAMGAEPAVPLDFTDSPMLRHQGPWSEEEYLALGESRGQRTELIDGGLVMSPVGKLWHQQVAFRLALQLHTQVTPEHTVFAEVNLRIGPGRIVIPDAAVVFGSDLDLYESAIVNADQVILVTEVVSPSSATMDRVTKPTLYAEAGIGWYLRIELDRDRNLQLLLYRLAESGGYTLHAKTPPGRRLMLPDLNCTIDVRALTGRVDPPPATGQ